jgi:hypothetical protein
LGAKISINPARRRRAETEIKTLPYPELTDRDWCGIMVPEINDPNI